MIIGSGLDLVKKRLKNLGTQSEKKLFFFFNILFYTVEHFKKYCTLHNAVKFVVRVYRAYYYQVSGGVV